MIRKVFNNLFAPEIVEKPSAGTCAKRSLDIGLAYVGIRKHVPYITRVDEILEFTEKLGLKCHIPELDYGEYEADNDPVMVIYADEQTPFDSIHHAVFCSDIQPFLDKEIKLIVYGWKELKEKSWLRKVISII